MVRKFRKFGFEINLSLSFEKVKRISVGIPDWADDTHATILEDGRAAVCYYKGSKKFIIELPKCTRLNKISLTPLYNKEKREFSQNRKIVVDVYN